MAAEAVQEARSGAQTGATVEFQVHFRNGQRGKRRLRQGVRPTPRAVESGRIPRITRLMALAIHFNGLIRKGAVRDYADLARLGGVTRARISQVMDLLNLAPEIQEELLFLPVVTCRDDLSERRVRQIPTAASWEDQITFFHSMCYGLRRDLPVSSVSQKKD